MSSNSTDKELSSDSEESYRPDMYLDILEVIIDTTDEAGVAIRKGFSIEDFMVELRELIDQYFE